MNEELGAACALEDPGSERSLEKRLLNDYQRDFPLVADPWGQLAAETGVSRRRILNSLRALKERGMISRVGPVFTPGSIGCSTLVSMVVPPARLTEVGRQISGWESVNHNYERFHKRNLWFVMSAADDKALQRDLTEMQELTGLQPLRHDLVESFHIDLGFPIDFGDRQRDLQEVRPAGNGGRNRVAPVSLTGLEKDLLRKVQRGLPLREDPYGELGRDLGLSAPGVIAILRRWIKRRIIKRHGVVVRHKELGYSANAMVVFHLDPEQIRPVGEAMARLPFITLCYQRRPGSDWPFNLFCMIHGTSAKKVHQQATGMIHGLGLHDVEYALLFSGRRFKQRGAVYAGSR